MPSLRRNFAKRGSWVLITALAASLGLHGIFLAGPDIGPDAEEMTPPALTAELRPPPQNPAVDAPPAAKKIPAPVARPLPNAAAGVPTPPAAASNSQEAAAEAETPPPAPAVPPGSGVLRYALLSSRINVWIGVAEYRWEFTEDGRYRLYGVTETTGIVSLFKPLRLETESVGRLVAGGLQPESYRTVKNGQATRENAEFDWSGGSVRLDRDGSVQPVAPGTQDILSLNFQIAYLAKPEAGVDIGVVTGRKYDRYHLEAVGEEELETPAGRFRSLHLRATGDNVTEIWVALDHNRLPVKIRFTDRKGDVYEQVVTGLE